MRFRSFIAIIALAAALHATSGHAQSSAIADNLSIDLQVELLEQLGHEEAEERLRRM
jgi:hypothetical protein